MKKIKFISSVLGLLSLALATPALASTPTSLSFVATSPTINSAQIVGLTWQMQDASGHSLVLSCQTGVVLVNASTNSVVNCGTNFSVSSSASDAISLQIFNFSGGPQTITATVSPTDSGGAIIGTAARSTYVTVATANDPIPEITVSTTSTASFNPVTISWVGASQLPGVNITLNCSESISATSSEYEGGATNVPCGVPIFESKLPVSGSVSFFFKNNTSNSLSTQFSLLPAMNSSSYDGTHAVTRSLTIGLPPKPAESKTLPITVNKNRVSSGKEVTVSWSTTNTSGVNFKIPCVVDGSGSVSAALLVGTSTTPIPCGDLAFKDPLPATGTSTLQFTNTSMVTQQMTLFIIPQINNSTYDATKGQSISLTIDPTNKIEANTQPPALVTATPSNSVAKLHYNFSKNLSLGSKNADVTALQNFLKDDKEIYPEGSVTGYFGPATQRALQRFQVKYGIAKKGEAGYGSVGPKTRAKLNTL